MYDGQEVTVTAQLWRNVIPTPQKDWTEEQRALVKRSTWTVVVAHHPGYKEPLVILMTVSGRSRPCGPFEGGPSRGQGLGQDFTAQQGRQVVRGRWGIEQPPQVAL